MQRVTEELMATTPYEAALHAVEQLTPEEQHRLRGELEVKALPQPHAVSDEIRRIRERIARRRSSTPEERAAARAALDRTATQIAAAWKGDMSALEAVQEQRRDV